EGCLVTPPFEPGGALHVNVAAANGGWLRAELLDADSGRPLDEYSAADCRPLEGDLLNARVQWKSRADLPRSPARVRARFLMRNAALFSFWLERGT
ncbi:MAG: glycosyl hydrolase family 32, partial [Lentisphaerae bacterium]|nr:glycosyl hydrolase family 32 [Lentisphaerota bacterium]